MGDSIDSDIIKRTQDTLGQIITAPALTEKLLSRPPVQFLQDIVKAVIKKTDFLQGLYTDEELTPAYLKEGRENKTLFMKKLVTAVYIAVKRAPEVRVSKILAGQEADKTNLLLQALAEAINSKVNNREVVRKTLQTLGESNENEEPPAASRDQKQSETRRTKEERSSHSRDRDRDREESSEKRSRSEDHSRDKGETDGSSQSKHRRSSRALDDGGSGERRAAPSRRQDDDDDNERKGGGDDEDDSRNRRSIRPTSAKGSRKHQDSSNHHRPSSPKSEQPIRPPPTLVSTDRDDNDGRPLVRPTTAAKRGKLMTQTSSDEIGTTSGKVLSGAQRGQGTLIVESKDTRDNDMNNDNDDDDDNFLIQEEKPSVTRSSKQDTFDTRGGDQDDDDADQHGGLVNEMMKSKKTLENGSEIPGQRAEVKTIAQNDAQRRREREKIQKDVDKLRETIQSLTKSVVPLGKILEFLQEDYEMMAKEMQHYTDEYKRTVVELRKEKFTTDQNLEPLRAALLDFDDQIADMKNRIIFMKKKVSTNEKNNAGRLLDIIRKAK
ncbi:unnamed protein product [Adineta ricciae]|uniref:TRAF3-interacting protein 1 n=1 Tax=Adineta ricciae TaxID=249248 RepID=A0A814ZBW3_ADIRI|nr:unnamed protein product [Adineta ricciae]CAF1241762.1 unnamed protein product [Adineta ricciae]